MLDKGSLYLKQVAFMYSLILKMLSVFVLSPNSVAEKAESAGFMKKKGGSRSGFPPISI